MTTSSKRKSQKKQKISRSAKSNGKTMGNELIAASNSENGSNKLNLFASKRMPTNLHELFKSGNAAPWLWCLSDYHVGDSAKQSINDLYKSTNKKQSGASKIEAFFELGIAQLENGDFKTEDLLNSLAWMNWCVQYRQQLSDLQLSKASQQVVDFIDDLPNADIDDDPLAHQILNCETILTTAYLFKSFEQFQTRAKAAIDSWSNAIDELLDGDGWLVARYWSLMRALLACWTRCSILAGALKLSLPKERRLQLEWLVRQALRSTRKDGLQFLGATQQQYGLKKFWLAALDQFGDKEDRLAAERILESPELGAGSRKSDIPEFSGCSEWAGTSVMRCSWENNSSKLAVLFGDRQVHIEIENKNNIVSDFRLPIVSFDNEILSVESDIEVACWHSDDDVDYLELEIELTNHVVLQRQILLAREDNFVFLADAIVSPEPGLIHYTSRCPVGKGMAIMNESETNELYIKDKSIRALVLPLSVPEWQIQKSRNTCHNDENSLTIEQQVNGQHLYSALFFDLESRRAKKPRTWRHLTVAQRLHIIHDDSVRGYRVQVGKEQWVFYRSLAPVASRTFLGQNVNCEFYAGRFDQYGETEELISID